MQTFNPKQELTPDMGASITLPEIIRFGSKNLPYTIIRLLYALKFPTL